MGLLRCGSIVLGGRRKQGGMMSNELDDGGPNRRDLLKGAAGLAAFAAVAGVASSSQSASAATGAVTMRISVQRIGDFDLLAYSWGASSSARPGTPGQVNVQDLSFTKYMDTASPLLLRALFNTTILDKATLTVTQPSGTVISYVLSDVLLTSVSEGGSNGESQLTENVTMAFDKLKFTLNGVSAVWP